MKKRIIIAFGLLGLILLGVLMFAPAKLGGRVYYYPLKINLMIGQRFHSPDDRECFITYSGKDDSTFIISEVIVFWSGFGQGVTIIEYRLHVGDKIYVGGSLYGRMYEVVRGSSDNIVLERVGDSSW